MNLPFTKTVSHLRSFSMRSFKHKIDLWNLMLSMFQKNIEVEDCSKATTSSAMIWGLAGDYNIRLWTFLPKPNAISDSVSFFHDKNTNFPCMHNPFHNLWKHDTTKVFYLNSHFLSSVHEFIMDDTCFTNKNFSTRPCHITMQRTCCYGQHVTTESGKKWTQLSYIKSAAGYSVDPPALPSLDWLTGTPRPI